MTQSGHWRSQRCWPLSPCHKSLALRGQMKRRDFIVLIGGATATWPVKALAQQTGKLPTIGFLGASASGFAPWAAAFVARLRELGWIEGRTVAIEYRWSEGRPERYAEIAAEFVRLKVDVILTVGSAVPIVRQATTVIPIVLPSQWTQLVAVGPIVWRNQVATLPDYDPGERTCWQEA